MKSWRTYAIAFLIADYFNTLNSIPRQNTGKSANLKSFSKKLSINPEYYLVTDSSSDLPYDFYRPGEENERVPIYLQMPSGELSELSRSSDIVDAISGKRRTDHKIYFPEDILAAKRMKTLYTIKF